MIFNLQNNNFEINITSLIQNKNIIIIKIQEILSFIKAKFISKQVIRVSGNLRIIS